MPEGPECTIVTNQLDKEVRGWSLVDIKLLTGRYTRKEPDGFYEFMSILYPKYGGTYIHGVCNKGKFIPVRTYSPAGPQASQDAIICSLSNLPSLTILSSLPIQFLNLSCSKL